MSRSQFATDGICFLVSKKRKCLYALDLDSMTYEASSTVSGAFNRQPDQVKAVLDDPLGLGKSGKHITGFCFSCTHLNACATDSLCWHKLKSTFVKTVARTVAFMRATAKDVSLALLMALGTIQKRRAWPFHQTRSSW